jgi:hypothetical protein
MLEYIIPSCRLFTDFSDEEITIGSCQSTQGVQSIRTMVQNI